MPIWKRLRSSQEFETDDALGDTGSRINSLILNKHHNKFTAGMTSLVDRRRSNDGKIPSTTTPSLLRSQLLTDELDCSILDHSFNNKSRYRLRS
jgi:hypothetical protein